MKVLSALPSNAPALIYSVEETEEDKEENQEVEE